MTLMRNMFRRLFAPSIFEDEEKTRTAQTLNTFGWVAFFMVLLLTISRMVSGEWLSVSSRLFFPALLFILFFTQVLIRKGHVRTAGSFMVVLIWSALTYQAVEADGLRDIAVFAYSILVLLAALLLGWMEGLFTGLLSLGVIWFFAYQEYMGIRQYSIDPPLSYARDLSAVFIITCVLTYILIRRLNRSLSDARLELRERLRADEKLQVQASYLTALHETTFGLLNRLELKPLLESLLVRVSILLGTPNVGIDLILPDGSSLRQELGNGIYEERNGVLIEKGVDVAGQVWERGETVLVQEYQSWEGRDPKGVDERILSVAGAPLKTGDTVLGVLLVATTVDEHRINLEQVSALEKLAALASLAIDNARLYEEAQRELNERKAAEEALRSSENRFRKVFNNGNIAISIVTLDEGVFLEANEAFWKLSSLIPEKALGQSALDLHFWQNEEARGQFIKDLLENGSLENVEVEFTGEDGETRSSIAYYELINIKNQNCILCMFYDVSDKRQALRNLKESEERTRAIIASIPDMIFEISKDGVFLDFMASADLVPIMEPHEFIGRNIKDMFPAGILQQTMFALERALSSGQVHAFEYGMPPGEEIQFFEARVAPVTSESAIIMVRDISQRKWVETEREKLIKELEDKNAESETLRESMAIIVETLDETRAVSLILEQLEKVIPYDSASVQLLRADVLEIVSIRRLDPPEEHIGRKFEVSLDEPSYPLIVGQAPYILVEDVQVSMPTFKKGDRPNPHIRSWLAIPLKVKGNVIGIIVLDGHSVSQFSEKDAELAVTYANQVAIALENARLFSEVQKELVARKGLIQELEEKNAELERFTYTVSHDLKSPIITIRGFLGFLEQDALTGNLPRLRGDVKRISDATDKMQTLLNELLDLSRIGRLVNPPKLVPFNEIVYDALDLVQGRIQTSRVQVHIQEDMDAVYVDRQRMVEVVQNLIDNASKFVSENPRIEIGQLGQEGSMLIFYIRDNGIGIPSIHHERIFGLFNKLEADSEGTGVGLALVRRIIEIHNGRIWVNSEPGKGATFYFTLPSAEAPSAEPES
jgi:PAS domain S-box-containing protein